MAKGLLGRHPDFARLWFGQTASQVGSQVSLLALPLIAISTLHATPFQVGLLAGAETLPFLLVGLPAGVWVDRTRRRPLLVLTDLGRAALLASVPIAYATDGLTLWHLFAVAFGVGVLTVLFDVAYHSYVPSLVPPHELLDANARLEMSRSAAQAAGPGLGGALVEALKAPVALIADSISFVVSAVALLTIRTPEAPPDHGENGERAPLAAAVREGMRHVLRNPLLVRLATCTSLYNLFSAMAMAVFLLYAVRELGLSAAVVGAIFSVGGIGFVIGAALSGPLTRRVGVGRALALGAVLQSVPFVLVPLAPRDWPIPFFTAALLVEACASPVFNVTQVSLRQAVTPTRLQGRMTATMRFLIWGALPLGSFLGGTLGSWIGPRATLWVAAVGTSLSALPALGRPLRTLKELPVAETPAAERPVIAGGAVVHLPDAEQVG